MQAKTIYFLNGLSQEERGKKKKNSIPLGLTNHGCHLEELFHPPSLALCRPLQNSFLLYL